MRTAWICAGLALAGSVVSAKETAWTARAAWIGFDDTPSVTKDWPQPDYDRQPKQIKLGSQLPAVYLRKDFEAKGVARAILRVTAEGLIVPYLNGTQVAGDYFTPGWTDYHQRIYTRCYEVSTLMKDGANTLGAVLGDGWFRGRIAWHGSKEIYGNRIRAKMELEVTLKDGKVLRVATDDTWKASTGPIIENDFLSGETYDARLEQPGWCAPGFNAAAWKPVVVGNPSIEPKTYEPHPSPAVRAYSQLRPIAITEPAPGAYVFDFGQNFAGLARLSVSEPAGTKVTLRFAEMLNTNGTFYTSNLRSARAVDNYICRGAGIETWTPLFTFHGFRYVEVTGLTHKPTLATVTGCALSTDNRVTGSFECSDPTINKVFSNTYWGQRSNYLEVPTDCPQRDERLGWTGDAQAFSRTGLYNEDAAAFLGKFVTDLNDAQGSDGHYTDTAPGICSGWSPAWGDAGIVVPFNIWRATGDTSVICKHFDGMKRFLSFYSAQSKGFIIPEHGYGDWLAIGKGMPKTIIGTAYFAHDADLMSRMALAIGRKAEAERYRKLYEDVSAAFRATFVGSDGKIGFDSQTCYILPLAFKLLTPEQEKLAAAHLARLVETEPGHICGFVGINFILPVLQQIGRTDLAFRLLERHTYPSWGYEVDQGATTIWERWNSFTREHGFGDVGMNSFNHYAFGSCVEWYYEGILGINPEEPGFARIRIQPQVGGKMTWAKGHYDSVRGRIAVEWHRDGSAFKLKVSVPAGVPAEVVLPDGEKKSVSGEGEFACKL